MVDVQNKPEWGDLLAQLAVRSPVSLEIPGSSHTGRALHYRQFGAPPVNEAGQLTIYNFKPERTQRAGEQSREAHRTKASGKIGGGGGGVGGYRRVHVVDEDPQTAQAVGLYKLQATRTAGVRPMHPHTSSVTICSGWTNRRASLADSHHAHPPRATHTLRERCRLALRRRTWNR